MVLGKTAVILASVLFTKLKGTQFEHNQLQISCEKLTKELSALFGVFAGIHKVGRVI